jgi:phosphoserine phosphatase
MKYAIYDFDGTLLQTQTVPFILRHWKKLNLTPKLYQKLYRQIIFRYLLVKSKLFGMKYDQFRYWSMAKVGQLFSGVSMEVLSQFFDSLYQEASPFLHKKVIKHIQKDKEEGYQTVLLSGNFDVFLERFRPLGFDYIIGTPLYNLEGKIPATITMLSADQKIPSLLNALKDLQWSETKAYTDSYADIQLLNQVKHPICVTPDKRLIAHAKANQWRIIL